MPVKSDLTGQCFGKLTVLEKMPNKQDRYYLWRCRCDCGGEILVNTKRLKQGKITNCGCVPKKNARCGSVAEDLTGRQFGKLSVLSRAESRRGQVAWLCRCTCGRLHTATAHDLKSGHVKSCGCRQYYNNGGIVDIAGQKFGRLTVLYATSMRDRKGSVIWHCRCDCGNEIDVVQDNLVYGSYRSCGCLRQELLKNIPNQLHRVDGTCIEWLERRKHRCDNTSGFRGVSVRKNGTYRVTIGFKKKRFYIGTYQTFEQAVEHRLEIEELIHDGFVKAYYEWVKKADNDAEWAEENPLIFEVKKENGNFLVITDQGVKRS